MSEPATLGEKVDWIRSRANEVAFGWSDSGCHWLLVMGGRGAGSMIEQCVQRKYHTAELDEEGFEAAVDEFIRQIKTEGYWRC